MSGKRVTLGDSEEWAERFIDKVVKPYLEQYDAALEEMCERMLVDPKKRGIFVTRYSDLTWKMELSEEIPFGEVCTQTVYYPNPERRTQ